ncbi:barstar family protein [Nocardia australiensis]|uniref:barstar family protein n=1 Tax=Nocardia australiensis TaxID=2887191 RepID=UPI001D14FC77|nr:barstar family protein [Nocardia australiensis]
MTAPIPLSRFLARPTAAEPSGSFRSVSASQPALGALAVDAAELSAVRFQSPSGYVVRELRGPKMRATLGIFDEFAAAFQFPYYFGENKDAFDECLRDLDDFVGEAAGYVAVIRDSVQLLADQREDRAWFSAAIGDAAAHWSRKDIAFRVVLQGQPQVPGVVALAP